MKILIVTDDVELQSAFSDPPANSNEFSFCKGADHVLEVIRNKVPDVVVITRNSEIGDCSRLLKEIRTMAEFSILPVILLSSCVNEREHAMENGADEILEWPLDVKVLLFRAKRTIKMRKLEELMRADDQFLFAGQTAVKIKHDLYNPLTGIIATVQLLQMQTADPELERKLKTIEELAFHISEIVSGFGSKSVANFAMSVPANDLG